MNRGKSRDDAGDLAGAHADLQRTIRLCPRLPDDWNARARVHADRRRMADALRDFDRAIVLDRRYVSAILGRPELHIKKGRIPKALGDYRRARSLFPADSEQRRSIDAWIRMIARSRS